MHELLHVLGDNHEQNRPDRDDFVTVHWENIESDKRDNYYKTTFDPFDTSPLCKDVSAPPFSNLDNCQSGTVTTAFGLPYDYESVMHYGMTE